MFVCDTALQAVFGMPELNLAAFCDVKPVNATHVKAMKPQKDRPAQTRELGRQSTLRFFVLA